MSTSHESTDRAIAFLSRRSAIVSFIVGLMPIMQDGPGGESAKGWQGDELDTEIETLTDDGRTRYRWSIYDRANLVKTGVARTRLGANIASVFYGWRYQQTL